MFRKIILSFLFVLFFAQTGFCEDQIKLESGIFLKGKIIEMSDKDLSFQTNFGKKMTYPLDDIAEINGKSPGNTEVKYNIWKEQIYPYYLKSQKILSAVIQDFKAFRKLYRDSANLMISEEYIKEFRNRLFVHRTGLESLTVPKGLEAYHQKLIEHIVYLDESQNDILNKRFRVANENLTLANTSYYEAIMDLQKNFYEHDAPPEILNELDSILIRFEASLKQEY